MAVLLVVTNWDHIGDTGIKTGWYLPEVAHPYYVLKEHGVPMTICSPKGGFAPMDPSSGEAFKDDPECKRLLADDDVQKQLKNTVAAKDVDPSKFKAIVFTGGHGPMFDFPDSVELNKAAADIYEAGGIAAAVCHGTAGLVNTTLKDGSYLVKGHKVTSFTNSEEISIKLMDPMPFALETRLKEHGADFVDGGDWQKNVQVSGRVITGQNPASATGLGEAIAKKLKEL